MTQELNLNLVVSVINYILSNDNVSFDDVVEYLKSIANMEQEWAEGWLSIFVNAICQLNLHDYDVDFAYQWIKEQGNNLDTIHIATMLSSTIGNLLLASNPNIDAVNVVYNGQSIQTIEKPQQVNEEELQAELEDIEQEIQEIQNNFLSYPENASPELKMAVDMYNENMYGARLADLEGRKEEILRLLNGD